MPELRLAISRALARKVSHQSDCISIRSTICKLRVPGLGPGAWLRLSGGCLVSGVWAPPLWRTSPRAHHHGD